MSTLKKIMGSSSSKSSTRTRKPIVKKMTGNDKAILDLKIQRDRLKQYQKKIEVVIAREIELAKQALSEDKKDRAMLILKKKKYQEDMLAKTDAQLLNLEQMTSNIEYALVEVKLMEGIKQGNRVLEKIHAEMSIEDVEKLMLDTADAIAYQNEISNLLSSAYTSNEDEKALEEELAALQQESLHAKLPDAGKVRALPQVQQEAEPTHERVANEDRLPVMEAT